MGEEFVGRDSVDGAEKFYASRLLAHEYDVCFAHRTHILDDRCRGSERAQGASSPIEIFGCPSEH
jgi:hypothetical protein